MVRVLLVLLAVPAFALAETRAAPASRAPSSDAVPVSALRAAPIAPSDAAPPAAPSPASPTDAPATISASWGELSIGLLLQAWFTATSDSRFSAGATTAKFDTSVAPGSSTFRMRRAETSIEGRLANGIGLFRLMIDPAIVQNGPLQLSGGKNNPATNNVTGSVTAKDILQDFYVGANIPRLGSIVPQHELRFGQFKIPITMEGFGSSAKLDFAERAIVTRTFGDQRDLGLMLLSKDVRLVEYQVALVNGTGKNVTDNSPHKTGLARLVYKPLKGVSVGGSGQLGSVYDSTSKLYLKTNRVGAELAVEMFNAVVKGEYVRGASGVYDTVNGRYSLSPVGWYGTIGYWFGPAQLVARYERWDSDEDTAAAQCRSGGLYAGQGSPRCVEDDVVSVGVNYEVAPKTRYQTRLALDYYNDYDRVQKVRAHEAFFWAQFKL